MRAVECGEKVGRQCEYKKSIQRHRVERKKAKTEGQQQQNTHFYSKNKKKKGKAKRRIVGRHEGCNVAKHSIIQTAVYLLRLAVQFNEWMS